jgi:hypothetical protein
MKIFLGVQVLMENTSSADLKIMKVHFKHVQEKYGTDGLSFQ